MEKRLRGGSRFNLRGVMGTTEVSPNQLMDWLREYVDFSGQAGGRPPISKHDGPILRRGMSMDEVRDKLGHGKLLSEAVGAEGILTQQWEFITSEHLLTLTAVEGLVVKYSMNAR